MNRIEKEIILSESNKVKAFLVIDSSLNGITSGGIRMLPDVTINEIRDLAKAMTLKHGFTRIPLGGCKAGIVTSVKSTFEEKVNLITDFAYLLKKRLGKYTFLPGSDMGSNQQIIKRIPKVEGILSADLGDINSAYYTAMSVMVSIKAATNYMGKDYRKLSYYIEGFGNVGRCLAKLLSNEHCKIVAISDKDHCLYDLQGLNIPDIISKSDFKQCSRRNIIPYKDSWNLHVDIICPCGRSYQIDNAIAKKIKAHFIISGSNNPILLSAEEILQKRGILALPDFFSNSGGVAGVAMKICGLNDKDIGSIFKESYTLKISKLLYLSNLKNKSPILFGRNIAKKAFQRMQRNAKKSVIKYPLFKYFLKHHKNRHLLIFLPRRIIFALFKKRMIGDLDLYDPRSFENAYD